MRNSTRSFSATRRPSTPGNTWAAKNQFMHRNSGAVAEWGSAPRHRDIVSLLAKRPNSALGHRKRVRPLTAPGQGDLLVKQTRERPRSGTHPENGEALVQVISTAMDYRKYLDQRRQYLNGGASNRGLSSTGYHYTEDGIPNNRESGSHSRTASNGSDVVPKRLNMHHNRIPHHLGLQYNETGGSNPRGEPSSRLNFNLGLSNQRPNTVELGSSHSKQTSGLGATTPEHSRSKPRIQTLNLQQLDLLPAGPLSNNQGGAGGNDKRSNSIGSRARTQPVGTNATDGNNARSESKSNNDYERATSSSGASKKQSLPNASGNSKSTGNLASLLAHEKSNNNNNTGAASANHTTTNNNDVSPRNAGTTATHVGTPTPKPSEASKNNSATPAAATAAGTPGGAPKNTSNTAAKNKDGSPESTPRQPGDPITLNLTAAQLQGLNAAALVPRPTTAPNYQDQKGLVQGGDLKLHDSWHQDDNQQGVVEGAAANSNTSIQDYIIGKQIGQGAYATVRLAVHKPSGKKIAIKIYEKTRLLDPQRRKSVRREIRVMDRLSHPNIVRFYEVADTSRQVFLVLEYINGGSLHYLLKKRPHRRLTEYDAKSLFTQVCQGIKYCHERLVVHRDIKLENVLVQYHQGSSARHEVEQNINKFDPRSVVVKLIDFGFASLVVPGKKLRVFCGTPSYMAPEIIQRREYGGYCVDVWALAILLFAMCYGQFPFRGQTDKELYKKILKGQYTIPEQENGTEPTSKAVKDMLAKMFVSMDVRPTIHDVMRDGWMQDGRLQQSTTKDQHSQHTASTVSKTASPNNSSSSSSTGRMVVSNSSGKFPFPLREEAIVKLEKLGYHREEVLRQLKDDNSHLYKLYTRFVKALNAWGK